MSLFKLAYDALTSNDVDEKVILTSKLIHYKDLKDVHPKCNIKKILIPGRPHDVNFISSMQLIKREASLIRNLLLCFLNSS